MAEPTAAQRLVYRLPVIRGVCVLAVILTHATASILSPLAAALVPEVFANTLARFAVPLFVGASGFYLSLNSRNEHAGRFYRRTLPGLVWPYLFYSAVYAIYWDHNLAHVIRRAPDFLLRGSADAHLWFIPVIVELYIAHPFLRRWYGRIAQPSRAVVVALVVQVAYGAFVELATTPGQAIASWSGVAVACSMFLKCAGYFVAGYWLRDNAETVRAVVGRPGVCAFAAATWVVAGGLLPAIWASGFFACCAAAWAVWSSIALEALLIPLSLSAFVMLAGWPRDWAAPRVLREAVQACGLYSYGVYYVHLIVLYALGKWLWVIAPPMMAMRPLRALLLVVCDAAVSVAVVKLLARLPLTRALA
jgi:surface polysaccharide O-acyltransferase-like enzyme